MLTPAQISSIEYLSEVDDVLSKHARGGRLPMWDALERDATQRLPEVGPWTFQQWRGQHRLEAWRRYHQYPHRAEFQQLAAHREALFERLMVEREAKLRPSQGDVSL